LPDLFHSFLPLHNPLGFGAVDFLELYVALALALLMFAWRPVIEPLGKRVAQSSLASMLLLAILPVALRLYLLSHHPIPAPDIYDEFGHLLVADTLRHFRFANPPHQLHQFFETFFTLQQPTYSSIYPIGQGLMLAIGRLLTLPWGGIPWAGVVISTAAFCALTYWMLRAWITPAWALAGGMLAVFEFGPLSQWMNSYWGGAFGAATGCLVFGALPRLIGSHQRRYAIPLGIGLGLHLLIRPYESLFLLFCVALYLAPMLRQPAASKALLRALPIVAGSVIIALGITAIQNRSVTGSWTTLPYQLSQYQYGVPAALTFQANMVPHNELTPQQELGYKSQLAFRSNGPETISSYLARLQYRIRYYRFFFLPPLYLAILAFFPSLRRPQFAWVAFTLSLFALGTNFFPAFQLHYLAAVTCLFVLVSVVGLQRIYRWNRDAGLMLLFLCIAHFAFWYGMHVRDTDEVSLAARPYETWDALNHRNPERRIEVNQQIAQTPGKVLVFVRYWPQHIFQEEWVYNAADIDHARVVWARDLGEPENEKLRKYYPDRSVWLLEADARPPRLSEYHETPQAFETVAPLPSAAPSAQPEKKKDEKPPSQPQLRFEDVPR
jgi:hypothetical protein